MPRLIFSDRQILVLPLIKAIKLKLARDNSYGKAVKTNHVIDLPVGLSLRYPDSHYTTP